jgi:hypothetical protein
MLLHMLRSGWIFDCIRICFEANANDIIFCLFVFTFAGLWLIGHSSLPFPWSIVRQSATNSKGFVLFRRLALLVIIPWPWSASLTCCFTILFYTIFIYVQTGFGIWNYNRGLLCDASVEFILIIYFSKF